MNTASEIIAFMKSNAHKTDFTGLRIEATKKIKGHATVHLSIPKHNIYDLHVWGSGSQRLVERIDLRSEAADEKLAQYV